MDSKLLLISLMAFVLSLGCKKDKKDGDAAAAGDEVAADGNGDDATADVGSTSETPGDAADPAADEVPTEEPAEEKPVDPAAPPANAVSYAKNVAPLIKENCLAAGCHSGAEPAAELALETKQNLIDAWEMIGELIEKVEVPEAHEDILDAAEIKVLVDWEAAGSPD